jgi:hypothetical protein
MSNMDQTSRGIMFFYKIGEIKVLIKNLYAGEQMRHSNTTTTEEQKTESRILQKGSFLPSSTGERLSGDRQKDKATTD